MTHRAKPDAPQRLRGKIVAFNISPKGQIESAEFQTTTGVAQVNFPKHEAEGFVLSMHMGSDIDIHAELEASEGDHPVYTAVAASCEAAGTIVRLNHSLHGEVNGYRLNDGTFVHVKPDGAKRYKLRVGEKVRAVGIRRHGTDANVLEADSVTRMSKRDEVADPPTVL